MATIRSEIKAYCATKTITYPAPTSAVPNRIFRVDILTIHNLAIYPSARGNRQEGLTCLKIAVLFVIGANILVSLSAR